MKIGELKLFPLDSECKAADREEIGANISFVAMMFGPVSKMCLPMECTLFSTHHVYQCAQHVFTSSASSYCTEGCISIMFVQ